LSLRQNVAYYLAVGFTFRFSGFSFLDEPLAWAGKQLFQTITRFARA